MFCSLFLTFHLRLPLLSDVHFDFLTNELDMFVFPGIGLGVTLCGAKTVSDRMLYVAAEALANYLTEDELAQGKVFPNLSTIRDVSKKVAIAVIKEAIRTDQAPRLDEKALSNLDAFVEKKMYDPVYVPLIEKRSISI